MSHTLNDFEEEYFQQVLPTARHEFGHYAVARHLGFKTFSVQLAHKAAIVGPGGQAEMVVMRPLRTLNDVRAYSEDRLRVLMAGVLAEAMEDGVIENENAILYVETSGKDDFGKYREHLRILHNIDHPDTTDHDQANQELKVISDRLWNETGDLVIKYGSFIELMARELAEKETKHFENPCFTEAELAIHPLVLKTFPYAGMRRNTAV